MRVDGQTDMTTIKAGFRNFAKAPTNVISGKIIVKTTEMETFWQFSKSQAFMQKVKTLYFIIINETSHFGKYGFFDTKSFVSAVARFLPCISTNSNDKYSYW